MKAWIGIFDTKKSEGGAPSSNIIVRNNAAPILPNKGIGFIEDHNVAIVTGTNTDAKSVFIDFQPQVKYDLRPRAGCALIGAGNAALAPATDIVGTKRTSVIDAGAYAAK